MACWAVLSVHCSRWVWEIGLFRSFTISAFPALISRCTVGFWRARCLRSIISNRANLSMRTATSNAELEPALAIVIVSWNTRELLRACVQSVLDTTRAAPLQIIVVDNASSDGSPEMIRQRFPHAQLRANATNVGFARANNQAFALCRAKYVLLLNSDAQLLPGTAQPTV
ncbi:MAG: hypothetical protein B6D41_21055 [Chloroflexi bacterium UTCFX4]|nr:MAG: hypothetical protein B6D41_21055 [Chloroflexi bacterium UTCFX4]